VPSFQAVGDRLVPLGVAALPGALALLAPLPLLAVALTAGVAAGGAYGAARFLPGVSVRACWVFGVVTLVAAWGSLAVLGLWPPVTAPPPVALGLWAGSLAAGVTVARAWLRRG
jgi:hypothetical protein